MMMTSHIVYINKATWVTINTRAPEFVCHHYVLCLNMGKNLHSFCGQTIHIWLAAYRLKAYEKIIRMVNILKLFDGVYRRWQVNGTLSVCFGSSSETQHFDSV